MLFLHTVTTQLLLFKCLYFYMHSNQTIIEYKSLIVVCVNYIMGAAILHDQVQQMIHGHRWMRYPMRGVESA